MTEISEGVRHTLQVLVYECADAPPARRFVGTWIIPNGKKTQPAGLMFPRSTAEEARQVAQRDYDVHFGDARKEAAARALATRRAKAAAGAE